MVAFSLSGNSSASVWWNPAGFSFAASSAAFHSAPLLPKAFSSSSSSKPAFETIASVPGMSVASCLRTHHACVPIGRFFHAGASTPAADTRSNRDDTAIDAAAAPPTFKTSRRVARTLIGTHLSKPHHAGRPMLRLV